MNRTRLYLGGLNQDVRERDVEHFFEGYGRITDITLRDGYGFVEFADQRDADDAIHDLHGNRLLGTRITLENSRKPRRRQQYKNRDTYRTPKYRFSPARRTNFQVKVENLSSRIQWQDLKDFLTKVGKVTYAKAHNKHPNEGMVEFATYEDMMQVIKELDGAELNGRKIKIVETKRSRSKSRSPIRRAKSRTKSRSLSVPKSKSPSRSPKKVIKSEGGNSSFEPNLHSMEASRKRSREESEDDSRNLFKRSKSSGSEGISPCNN